MTSETTTTLPAGYLRFLDDAAGPPSLERVDAFRRILLGIVGVEAWCRALRHWQAVGDVEAVLLGLTTAAVCAGWDRRLERGAFATLAAILSVILWREFPAPGNHAYLELVLCLFCAGLRSDAAADRVLFMRAARWLLCVVLFYAGLQKLVHGHYLYGQYLAFSLSTESFRPILRPLLEAAEYERLLQFDGSIGDGPYRVHSLGLLLASNVVWVAELVLPVFLAWRPTRVWATLATFALVAAIEIGARELFFGLVFMNLACLFPAADWTRASRPWFALVLAGLLASRLGLAPELVFY